MITQHDFVAAARQVLDRVVETQAEPVREAAGLLAAAIRKDGIVHAFGTGHSRSLAMELAGRAGGLIPTNRMAIKDLVLFGDHGPQDILDPKLERAPEVARRIWQVHNVEPADVFVIASNSGRNGAIVEMAQRARGRGHPVIAITSVAHTSRVESRHPSGKKLHDVADVSLDNGAPFGDAVLQLETGGAACGISTLSGAMLVQMMVAETIGLLGQSGQAPPVYLSANVPGGDEHNDRLRARYSNRIRQGEA